MKKTIAVLGDKSITPEVIIGILHEDLPRMDGIVVVAFNKDGTHTLNCSCTRSELALGALIVQQHCIESTKQS